MEVALDLPEDTSLGGEMIGCPVCAAAWRAERSALSQLVGELPAETPALCAIHAQALRPLAPGAVESWTGRLLLYEAERFAGALQSRGGRRAPFCLACRAGRAVAEAEVQALLRALASAGERAAYAKGPGLCRGHLRLALRLASGGGARESARWLADDARRRLAGLVAELDRYFELMDYRNRTRPKGVEQHAWRRALAFFWSPLPAPLTDQVPWQGSGPMNSPVPTWAHSDMTDLRCLLLLRIPGCPACREARQAVAVHVRWLLVENYNSLPTIESLWHGGYCPAHARLLLDLDARQLSLTLLALARGEVADLESRWAAARPTGECPACAAAQNAAEVVVDDLRHLWKKAAGRRVYEAAHGLCRVHTCLALGQLGRAEAAWLRAAAADHLRRAAECGVGERIALLWSAPALPDRAAVCPPSGREWAVPIGRRLQSAAATDRE